MHIPTRRSILSVAVAEVLTELTSAATLARRQASEAPVNQCIQALAEHGGWAMVAGFDSGIGIHTNQALRDSGTWIHDTFDFYEICWSAGTAPTAGLVTRTGYSTHSRWLGLNKDTGDGCAENSASGI